MLCRRVFDAKLLNVVIGLSLGPIEEIPSDFDSINCASALFTNDNVVPIAMLLIKIQRTWFTSVALKALSYKGSVNFTTCETQLVKRKLQNGFPH